MFLNYIIFMLFHKLLINVIMLFLRNIKYRLNTKYPT